MADVTVTSDANYTIIIDHDDSGGGVFDVRRTSSAVGLAIDRDDTAEIQWEFVGGTTNESTRAGTFVLNNTAFTSPNAFKFSNNANFDRVGSIESSGELSVEMLPIRLPVVANGSLPSSPSEGQVVLEENAGATSVRLAVYLNGGWRYSSVAT